MADNEPESNADAVRGAAVVYGDDVDTDQIVPARHLVTTDPAELGRHCLEDSPKPFAVHGAPGRFVVAGRNFGCGSSREHAPLALIGAGVRVVFADSFARIFFRNAINVGLTVVECPGLARSVADGDEIVYEPGSGRVIARGATFASTALSRHVQEIVRAGGLVEFVRAELARRRVANAGGGR
jgi:3-isopropylmalate/(R)-2-methylmalate dehydratase small subunit